MRTPKKPNIGAGLRTGFRPAQGLNTSGRPAAIPHDSGPVRTIPAYGSPGHTAKPANTGTGTKRGRKMY